MSTSTQADPVGFVHSAFFYHSQREYLDTLVPFITDSLATAQPVLVAVPGENRMLLRDALGDAAADVTMADMAHAGRNPGRILGGVLHAFADKHPNTPVRMIGEPIWPGRTATEYPACVQHEALINLAFGERDLTVLCPYDAGRLDGAVLADARITHPTLWEGADSADYAPEVALARYNQPLSGNSAAAVCTVARLPDLAAARSFAARYAQWLRLSTAAIADLQLIATELATNSLHHTPGSCRLAFWQQHDYLICEARDSGRLTDPLAGRRPPAAGKVTGHGLFLINAIADLVRTHTGPQGTTIQAYLRLGEAA